MKRKRKIKALVIIIGLLLIFLIAHSINHYYHKGIREHDTAYAYFTLPNGNSVQVYIVGDEDEREELLQYYRSREEKPMDSPVINFRRKLLPMKQPVYVIGYSPDSLFAEVVSYYDYAPINGGSYTRGWVYSKALHDSLPKP